MENADRTIKTGDEEFNMSEGAECIEEAGKTVAALVTGRRTFDVAHARGGKHPMNIPVVVVLPRKGIRLFDQLGDQSIELESVSATQAPGVTRLLYHVMK